jgi:formylglycine-generating enzyme required for sulfatase activity
MNRKLLLPIGLLFLAFGLFLPPYTHAAPDTHFLWDGSETIEHYAHRVGLKATQSFDLGNGVKLEMVLIPAGKFIMGSPADEKDREGDENQHEVTITRPYYFGKFLLTEAQYQQVMNRNPPSPPDLGDPHANISWDNAKGFISELNKKLNKKSFRLPTEAEWEFACRAGTKTRFYTGDSVSDLDAAGWYESNAGEHQHPVGLKKPNAWGLYDMHGDLWQWCEDWLDPSGYPPGPAVDPTGPNRREDARYGKMKVMRGGSFHESAPNCRTARRGWLEPNEVKWNRGMRVCMSAELTR